MKAKKFLTALICSLLTLPMVLGLVACKPGDENPPAGPTALDAPVITLNEQTKTITWSAVENAEGYEIFENDESIADTTGLMYVISQTVAGNYTYHVVATTTDENYTNSSASNKVTYSVIQSKVLDKPVITLNQDTGVISWAPVSRANAYEVYENGQSVALTEFTNYTIQQKIAGTYSYAVKATNTNEDLKLTASELSDPVEYVVDRTELTFDITVNLPEDYDLTANPLTAGLYSGEELVKSEDVVYSQQFGNIAKITVLLEEDESLDDVAYTVKFTEIPEGYIATEGNVTAYYRGVSLTVFSETNKFVLGENTFDVSASETYSAKQYYFVAETGGIYTVSTTESKGLAIEIGGRTAIDTSSNRTKSTFTAGEGEVVPVTVVGNVAGQYTFEITEGEEKQYISIASAYGDEDNVNSIETSCNRYLKVEKDVTYTFQFTPSLGSCVVTFNINGQEYIFGGQYSIFYDITFTASTEDILIQITVEGTSIFGDIFFYVFPPTESQG